MLHIWRLELRGLGLTKADRHEFSMHVAIENSVNEAKAVKFARERRSAKWWEEVLITDVVYVGPLTAAEGLEVPQDED